MNASSRSKSFQSATGISYRYFFDSQGQSIPFEMIVYIADCALAAWRERQGRELDAQEKYVATKLGLFRGFDEEENLRENWLGLVVDETSLEELFEPRGWSESGISSLTLLPLNKNFHERFDG